MNRFYHQIINSRFLKTASVIAMLAGSVSFTSNSDGKR